eukprot:scaffold7564_cov117-Cylindrotheca_fusiformis.AAC.1
MSDTPSPDSPSFTFSDDAAGAERAARSVNHPNDSVSNPETNPLEDSSNSNSTTVMDLFYARPDEFAVAHDYLQTQRDIFLQEANLYRLQEIASPSNQEGSQQNPIHHNMNHTTTDEYERNRGILFPEMNPDLYSSTMSQNPAATPAADENSSNIYYDDDDDDDDDIDEDEEECMEDGFGGYMEDVGGRQQRRSEPCDCPQCQMNGMSSLFDFLRQMTEEMDDNGEDDSENYGFVEDEDEENDDDDEDDDDGRCLCPRCRFGAGVGHVYDFHNDEEESSIPDLQDPDGNIVTSDDDDEDDSDDDASEDNEDDSDDDASADPTAPVCSICFAHATSRNPFVTLPCCGKQGTVESTSTMRFCQGCMVKTIQMQEREQDANQYGVFAQFILSPAWTHRNNNKNLLLGECPRCRTVICCTRNAAKSNNRWEEDTSITLAKPTFEQIMKYAAGKPGMKPALFLISHLHFNVFPVELFQMDTERRLERLAQWGMLSTVVDGAMYKIEPENQKTMLEFMTSKEERPELTNAQGIEARDEKEWQYRAFIDTGSQYVSAVIHAKDQKKWRLCGDLAHGAIIMFWKAHSLLPHATCAELGRTRSALLAAMDLLLVCISLLGLVVAACFGGVGFGIVKGAGLIIKMSLEPKGPIRLGRIALVSLWHLFFMTWYRLGISVLIKASLIHGIVQLAGWFLLKKYEKVPADVVRIFGYVVHLWYLVRSAAVVGGKNEEGMDVPSPVDALSVEL